MPTALKHDVTSLRPAPMPLIRTPAPIATPVAETECGMCGLVGTGAHQCSPPAQMLMFMAPMRPAGSLGTREQIQDELDGIAMAVRAFHLKQPDQIMREVAGYSARLTELTVLLHRVEATDRQYTRVRTAQVDKWLVELDRQFKIASRVVEVMRQDIELSR